jgi:plastocyanin
MRTALILAFGLGPSVGALATTWVITNSNFTFSPTLLTINLGDTVQFVLGPAHDAREVAQDTWDSNGNTPLPEGFQTPDGGGFVYPDQLQAGTHYYVCTPHVVGGMKGRIVVNDPTTSMVRSPALRDALLYPVPVIQSAILEIDASFTGAAYVITDGAGRWIASGRLVATRTTLDLGGLPAGPYQLVIAADRPKVLRFLME